MRLQTSVSALKHTCTRVVEASVKITLKRLSMNAYINVDSEECKHVNKGNYYVNT